MPTLIKNKKIVENEWRLYDEESNDFSGKIIVCLKTWLTDSEKLSDKILKGEAALLLLSENTIKDLPDNYLKAEFIAIDFPKFVDGRGYSIARELRQKCDYKKEIRAVGDVLHDQINAMYRMGFDAVELSDEHSAEKALEAFSDFTTCYQADVLETAPVYQR